VILIAKLLPSSWRPALPQQHNVVCGCGRTVAGLVGTCMAMAAAVVVFSRYFARPAILATAGMYASNIAICLIRFGFGRDPGQLTSNWDIRLFLGPPSTLLLPPQASFIPCVTSPGLPAVNTPHSGTHIL
jgi:hypothetical protein